MDDLISRQAVIEINRSYHGQMPNEVNHRIWKEINELPSAQPEKRTEERTETHACDCIERQAAIDAMANTLWHYPNECYRNLNEYEFAKGLAELGLKSVPSAQPKHDISKANFLCPICGAEMEVEVSEWEGE